MSRNTIDDPRTASVQQVREAVSASPEARILDVRTPAEFATSSVEGAICIPLNRLDPEEVEKQVAKDEPCYLMCQSGGRAQAAARRLQAAGYTRLAVVDGGMAAWEEAGYPVKCSGRRMLSLDRQAFLAAGGLVLLGTLLAALVSPWWLLLTAFVGTGLTLRGATGFCGMAIMLSYAPWNRAGGSECAAG